MRIVHISDTHTRHEKVDIPVCDVICFTGDLGRRTNLKELLNFLVWFEKLPARKKIWIAGNHDICLDKKWVQKMKNQGSIEGMLAEQHLYNAKALIKNYDVVYLEEEEYTFEGVKFFGSPYSPSFHRDRWVFNADRGQEIKTHWGKIPSDVNVLLTHTPPYQVLDWIEERKKDNGEENNVGCKDLIDVIKKRLTHLKLHMFGHIHENVGVVIRNVSQTRRVIFSNGACVDDHYNQVVTKPFIIDL